MSNSDGSMRVFAGVAAFLVVFFAPNLLLEMFGNSFFTALCGLLGLAAAALVMNLIRLHQRVKRLETQTAFLQELLDKLQKKTDDLL